MMSRNIIALICLSLFLACQDADPCSTPESFVKAHTSFVNESIEMAPDYSNNDWKARDTEFEDLMDNCYDKLKDDLTGRQKETITTNSAKYVSKRVKNSLNFSFEGIAQGLKGVFNDDFDKGVEGIEADFKNLFDKDFEEKLSNVFDDDFKNKLEDLFDDEFKEKVSDVFDEEFKEDLKSTLENVGKELEGFGDQLIKVLEENLESDK